MLPVRARASFSYLRRHPWQLALSVLGIAIGVAVIIAVDIANSSARKAFLLSMDTVAGAATHQVIGGPRGVPETVYTSLRVHLGIDAIAPVVEGDIRVQEERLTLLGIDVFAESGVRSFTEVPGDDEGRVRRFLTEPGSVTMSTKTAELLGLEHRDMGRQ